MPDDFPDRFARDLTTALGHSLAAGDRLALAVSGGPDSMAMLALSQAALPGRVIAATVDHRLRPGSAQEADMVGAWCVAAGIPHRTLNLDPLPPGNLHALARTARYAVLTRWATGQGAGYLATAHHADDQAETFLMRANRGSGLAGLAGIRRRRVDAAITVVRPLLGWRRSTLRTLIESAGIPFVDDPSNDLDRFDRTRVRRHLAAQDLLDPVAIARSAAWCAEADADLRAVSDWLWAERRRPGDAGEVLLDAATLPRALRRMLLRTGIAHLRTERGITRPDFTESTNVEPLLDSLEAGKTATQAGIIVSLRRNVWLFCEAPPRRSL